MNRPKQEKKRAHAHTHLLPPVSVLTGSWSRCFGGCLEVEYRVAGRRRFQTVRIHLAGGAENRGVISFGR